MPVIHLGSGPRKQSKGAGVGNKQEKKACEGCLHEQVTAIAIGVQLTGAPEALCRTQLRLPYQGAGKPGHLSSGIEGHSWGLNSLGVSGLLGRVPIPENICRQRLRKLSSGDPRVAQSTNYHGVLRSSTNTYRDFFNIKILFIYSWETQGERQRHRQREKWGPHREPNVGLDSRSQGSRHEPKAQPLSYPGAPKHK